MVYRGIFLRLIITYPKLPSRHVLKGDYLYIYIFAYVYICIYIYIYMQGESVAVVHECGTGVYFGIAWGTIGSGGEATHVGSICIRREIWVSDSVLLSLSAMSVRVEGSGLHIYVCIYIYIYA